MLLSKKLDTFMVTAQYGPEPVKRFRKRHLPDSADQVVSIRHDLFFPRERKVVYFGKPKPLRLSCGNTSSDVPFYDVDYFRRKSKLPRDLNTHDRMVDPLALGPAYIVVEAALPDKIQVHCHRCALSQGKRDLRYNDTVGYNARLTTCPYQHLYFPHKRLNNTTLPSSCNRQSSPGDKKRLPHKRGSLVLANTAYLINGTIRSATMLMTLIIGLMAGPAVSL